MSYKDWINEMDVEIDYYSAFIKAWIAFNSWYGEKFPEEKTDQKAIGRVKEDNNDFRTHLVSLLKGDKPERSEFCATIGNLHNALSDAAFMTEERFNYRRQISFAEIASKNIKSKNEGDRRGIKYCIIDAGSGKLIVTITNTKGEIFKTEHESFNEYRLIEELQKKKISHVQENECLGFYREMCPYQTKSLLADSRIDKPEEEVHYVVMGSVRFIPDPSRIEIAKGIIEVLYLIRCALMHGDITPSKVNKKVYRYGYEVLSAVLRKLV